MPEKKTFEAALSELQSILEELESDFGQKKLHPGDLKNTVGEYMVNILGPIRDKITLSNELYELIKNSH